MRPYRVLLRGQGVFFAAQSSVDCITSMAGFDLRQAQRPVRLSHSARPRAIPSQPLVGGFADAAVSTKRLPALMRSDACLPPSNLTR
jgi:hypothetical protein